MDKAVGLGEGIRDGLGLGSLVAGNLVGLGVGMLDGLGLGNGEGTAKGIGLGGELDIREGLGLGSWVVGRLVGLGVGVGIHECIRLGG